MKHVLQQPLHTTLQFACTAAQLTVIEHASECELLPTGSYHVLGSGSNVLCATTQLPFVVQIACKGIELVRETADAFYVQVGAGEVWHDVVLATLAHGWYGLENLALIPGWAGAAPVQNIGAYGLELADRLDSVHAWDTHSRQHTAFTNTECQFGYRDSVFKRTAGRYWITSMVLKLPKPWQPVVSYADLASLVNPTAQTICDTVIAIRKRKLPDPAVIPNAGSFFKNPVVAAEQANALKTQFPALPAYPQPDGQTKLAAGWLIEQCGWKGYRAPHAAVGVHAAQALVLVHDISLAAERNTRATGTDLLALASEIQLSVLNRFNIALEREVNVWAN